MQNQNINKEDIANEIIVRMAAIPSEREKLISALAKNGVKMDDTTPNEELYTAIFSGIVYSKAFRNDIKKAVYSYLKSEGEQMSMDSSFSYQTGLGSAGLFAGQALQQTQATKTTTSGVKKPFKETAVGKFLGGLFTPENASNLANLGINALNQKLTQKADQQSIDQGIQYQVEKANTLDKEIQKEESKKKWVVPVIIASSVLVLAIIGYAIYKSNKK